MLNSPSRSHYKRLVCSLCYDEDEDDVKYADESDDKDDDDYVKYADESDDDDDDYDDVKYADEIDDDDDDDDDHVVVMHSDK